MLSGTHPCSLVTDFHGSSLCDGRAEQPQRPQGHASPPWGTPPIDPSVQGLSLLASLVSLGLFSPPTCHFSSPGILNKLPQSSKSQKPVLCIWSYILGGKKITSFLRSSVSSSEQWEWYYYPYSIIMKIKWNDIDQNHLVPSKSSGNGTCTTSSCPITPFLNILVQWRAYGRWSIKTPTLLAWHYRN